jgi:hypothetical protein
MLQLIGWIGSLTVIGSYLISTKKNNPSILHWGNVIGACMLVPVQIYLNVTFAAFISLSFGLIAAYGLYKTRSLDNVTTVVSTKESKCQNTKALQSTRTNSY